MSPIRKNGFNLIELMVGTVLLGGLALGVGTYLDFTRTKAAASQLEQRRDAVFNGISKFLKKTVTTVRTEVYHPQRTFDLNGQALKPSNALLSPTFDPEQKYTWDFINQTPGREKHTDFYNLKIKPQLSRLSPYVAYLDSHTLESVELKNVDGVLQPKFRYLLVSRCVKKDLGDMNELGDGKSTIDPEAPFLSSFYVVQLPRRPFYDVLDVHGKKTFEVRCCPTNNPNCIDGSLRDYLVRIYGIKWDVESNQPKNITEYPSLGDLDPVIGMGFFLHLGSTYELNIFTLDNRCLLAGQRDCIKLSGAPLTPIPNWYAKLNSHIWRGVIAKSVSSGGLIPLEE